MRPLALNSLRVQAVLWSLLPLTLIMLLVGSVGVFAYTQVVEQLVRDRDSALVRSYAARLSDNLKNQASVLEAVREEMHAFDCSDGAGNFDTNKCFAAQHGFLTRVTQRCLLDDLVNPLTLIYPDGTPMLSITSERTQATEEGEPLCKAAYQNVPLGTAYEEASFFQSPRQTGQTFFSDVLPRAITDEPQIILAVPLYDRHDLFVGVLAGSYPLREGRLGREIDQFGLGTAYLVDGQGRVIWHPDVQQRGADLSDQAAVRALLQPQAASSAQVLRDAQGHAVVVGYAPVEQTGWGLVIEESWDAILGPVATFQWVMLGVLAVGLLLVIVFISSGTRRLTDTMGALVEQTQLLAHGDLVGHVQGGSIAEMRALSDAFNEMADRVARYRTGLQHYVAAITQSQEAERTRIARELHDDTIQSLIALGRRLEMLEGSLENPIDAAKQLYQLQGMLQNTVAEVRQFSRDLRPLLLEDLGLVAAMRQMLREMERQDGLGTDLTIQGEASIESYDDELVVSLYRIAQEALNNIRKHAAATHVAVLLCFDPDGVRLEVRDDGRGVAVTETSDLAQRGSFGLMGIRERAKLFGGIFAFESTPGEGTCLSVYLPHTLPLTWLPDSPSLLPVPV